MMRLHPHRHHVYQTATAGYRLDSQLSAPRSSMTLKPQSCGAGPTSRYRLIHCFLFISKSKIILFINNFYLDGRPSR